MNVGDLVEIASGYLETEIGIITWVFSNDDVVVLFEDGEHQMNPEDLKVISENR